MALKAPVLIANDPVAAFAATVTDPGTVSPDSPVLLRLTTAPLDPAAFDSVTVQLPLAFAPSVVGLHCSEEITAAVARLMFTLCDAPPYDAVIEPLWSALNAPVLIANDPVVACPATETDPGTVNPESPVLLRLTTAPLDPAACDNVTVQFPLAFAPNVVGLHCRDREGMATGASKDSVVESDVPLYVAVTFAF